MWGCHGDLISSYPKTHLPLSLNTLHQHYRRHLLLPPPSCKQDGGEKSVGKTLWRLRQWCRWGGRGERRKRRRCDVEEQLVSRLANIICFEVEAFLLLLGAYFPLLCRACVFVCDVCFWHRNMPFRQLLWAHSSNKKTMMKAIWKGMRDYLKSSCTSIQHF